MKLFLMKLGAKAVFEKNQPQVNKRKPKATSSLTTELH